MIDPNHPRATSLRIRDQIVAGVKKGITSTHGLIAQGRGEAFDYLIGEETQPFAHKAIEAASALLLTAKHPVLSVNGNSAALTPEAYITLSEILNCPIEVNLFHRTPERELAIRDHLLSLGARTVLGVGNNASETLPTIASPRKYVSPEGIAKADVVFVPLEDGDRTEELIKLGKKVITVDLNPLSRTAQQATITIVDNLVRAMPELIKQLNKDKKNIKNLENRITNYNNKIILQEISNFIAKRFSS